MAKAKKKATTRRQSLKQRHILEVIELLKRYYPDVQCALNFSNPFELLIATILSAQCTDERVNQVTLTLFKKYPGPQRMAEVSLEQLEQDIKPTGFYRNKAKNIKACCEVLVKEHAGKVPKNLEALVKLGGVGRKTANVVLGNAYGIASGVVVDTHVTRLSWRLGWIRSKNAVIIERELNALVPQHDWVMFPHWLITHGRAVCKARKPRCETCFLEEHCPKKSYTKSS